MVGVERWAEIRRAHIEGVGIRALARRTGLDRTTIRRALRADAPPRCARGPVASKLDPHKEQIHELLRADPALPATRTREPISDAGHRGGRTILDVYRREVRPLFARSHHLPALYRPGEDLPVRPPGAAPPHPGRPRRGAGRLPSWRVGRPSAPDADGEIGSRRMG